MSSSAKAQFFHVHVTADDLHTPRPAPSPSPSQLREPVIPERTTSLHRHSVTWPPRTPSRAGSFKFDSVPTLVRTPWEVERHRPDSKWSRTSDRSKSLLPKRFFAELPREIYQCIVDHVDSVHTIGEAVDVLAARADLRSLCAVDKKFHRVAREHLYRHLWLPSTKTPAKRKWSRQQPKSRLRQLCDTLRGCPGLAFMVHTVGFTGEVAEEIRAQAYSPIRKDSTLDLVQSIIQQCYSLERVCGAVPPTTSSTLPFLNALASRTRLREHAWSLDSTRAELPGLTDFICCHDNWLNLETLVIAADPGVDLGEVAISAILSRLPSLKHLMVSGLHRSDFNNSTLLMLPPLKSLRLENVAGVTDRGVEQLAFSRLAPSLEQLRLVGLELVSLQTIGTLLSHLTRLTRFAMVQETSPEAQTGVKFVERTNSFSSSSLRHLHWDCLIPGTALTLFAESIQAGQFPELSKVTFPCDYEGIIQALCRPIPRMKLTENDMQYLEDHTQMYQRDLRVAQTQAQLRVRESRRQPSFSVVVHNESMEIEDTHVIGSYLGSMRSKIEYCLEPEAGHNALAEFGDVARPRVDSGRRVKRQSELDILF